jgi:hypothetical protein
MVGENSKESNEAKLPLKPHALNCTKNNNNAQGSSNAIFLMYGMILPIIL